MIAPVAAVMVVPLPTVVPIATKIRTALDAMLDGSVIARVARRVIVREGE
ncbi:MAG TPA: hypothetical protein VGH28_03740 [Polyangiaceae bacterium]|jgi:hypothetical protein